MSAVNAGAPDKSNDVQIENELGEHISQLKDLVDIDYVRPDDNSPYSNASHFMKRVTEDCEKKRIFICCDGTGKNASGTVDPLTNVAKFARAVHGLGYDDYTIPEKAAVERYVEQADETKRLGCVRQIVYYSSGVGTRSALGTDNLYAAAFGKGLSANLLDAYCFICNNYNFRSCLDEIVLVGFSRGAFTVRCLAQFMNDIGLLHQSGLIFLKTLYRLWKGNAGYKPAQWVPREQWPEAYRKLHNTLQALDTFLVEPVGGVRIKVLAEWDTVSAMGLWGNPLSFVGSKVPENVDNAFLAVSLHEKRRKFKPMLWDSEENRGTKTNIKQCIFAGCHSDIGGGNPDPALSAASFFWMVGQIRDCGCNAYFAHHTTTFEYVTPFQVKRSLWSKRPPVGLLIQSFAEGRVNESRRGWYAVPYWLSLTLWNGKRDSIWERFLKKEYSSEEDLMRRYVGLTTHVTVRLLYEHRHRNPAVEKGDHRLQCGLFKKYRPEVQGQVQGRTRWVKRGTTPKQFLDEDIMGDEEKFLLGRLLKQARALKDWSPDEKLEDRDNGCNWTEINRALNWTSIIKGCTYDQTFISLLENDLKPHTDGPKYHDEAPIRNEPDIPSGPGSSGGSESHDEIGSHDGAKGSEKPHRSDGAESRDGVESHHGVTRVDGNGHSDKPERSDKVLRDLDQRIRNLEQRQLHSPAPRRIRRASAPT
ncbi:uncharacterized protein PG986_002276 [Apiospora aurea]|uniref:T6SS Phospholipase effector Tle1-like catalytic domain-containing protein n=1 Tax=Apiospora aurea TaxID=335848 RepID=A0ABR1QZF2_9PEZI